MTSSLPVIYIFGNPDFEGDSIPFRILPELEKKFPNIRFVSIDPNEELNTSKALFIIDTIENIKKVSIFHDPMIFKQSPRVTVHDFDLATNLVLLKKLGKLPALTIVGIPPHLEEKEALKQTTAMLQSNLLSENGQRNSCKDRKPE